MERKYTALAKPLKTDNPVFLHFRQNEGRPVVSMGGVNLLVYLF